MPELTKGQVITRWIICAVIGIALSVFMMSNGGFANGDSSGISSTIISIAAPVLIAWVFFGFSLCWKEYLKLFFTLHWIKALILYFKSFFYAIKVTVKAFTKG